MLYSNDYQTPFEKMLEQFPAFVIAFRKKVAEKRQKEQEEIMKAQGVKTHEKDVAKVIIEPLIEAGMPRNVAFNEVAGNWKTKILMMGYEKYDENKNKILGEAKNTYHQKASELQGHKWGFVNWIGRRLNNVSEIFDF